MLDPPSSWLLDSSLKSTRDAERLSQLLDEAVVLARRMELDEARRWRRSRRIQPSVPPRGEELGPLDDVAEGVNELVRMLRAQSEKSKWTRGDIIAFATLLTAIISILVSILSAQH